MPCSFLVVVVVLLLQVGHLGAVALSSITLAHSVFHITGLSL